MAGDRQREPLWASGLADQPVSPHDALFEPPRRDEERQAAAAPSVDVVVVVLSLLAMLTLAAAGAILTSRTDYARQTVLSGWEDIPMTCDTRRFTQDDRTAELFECRALAGGRLPPGVYRSPDARWRSDLTGEQALRNVITIARDGALTGFAVY